MSSRNSWTQLRATPRLLFLGALAALLALLCVYGSVDHAAAAAGASGKPAGWNKTHLDSWVDPRPASWKKKFPLFAAPSTGDGSLAAAQRAGQLTVCADTEIKPLAYQPPGSSRVIGYEVDLLKDATKLLGINSVKYVDIPFASYIPALQAGKCAVLMGGLSPRSDRAAAPGIKFTYPYDHFTDIVVVKSGGGVTKVSQLRGKAIAAVTDSVQAGEASALASKVGASRVLTFQDQSSVDLAVANGTAGAAVDSPVDLIGNPLGSKLRRLNYEVPTSPPAQFANEYKVDPYNWGDDAAVTRSSEGDLNVALSIAFKQLDSDGVAKAIYQKWKVYQTGVFDVCHACTR